MTDADTSAPAAEQLSPLDIRFERRRRTLGLLVGPLAFVTLLLLPSGWMLQRTRTTPGVRSQRPDAPTLQPLLPGTLAARIALCRYSRMSS